jgi:hypothetical protein
LALFELPQPLHVALFHLMEPFRITEMTSSK